MWGQPLRPDLVHTTLVWARACQRSGTASAKSKGEVSGTGKKPFAQKGRGKARQGSLRSPQFVGGGVAHPPRPRDFSYTLPKKVRPRLSGRVRALPSPPLHGRADGAPALLPFPPGRRR